MNVICNLYTAQCTTYIEQVIRRHYFLTFKAESVSICELFYTSVHVSVLPILHS